MSGAGIYCASRASIPGRAALWRAFRAAGYPVVSTWIDEAAPGATADRGELMARCIREASSCAAFVLFIDRGDLPLKIAYAEWGAAAAAGAPAYVVCFEPDDAPHGRLWDHPGTTRVRSVEEAMRRALNDALAAGAGHPDGCHVEGPLYLGTTKSGAPVHPLYQPTSAVLRPWDPQADETPRAAGGRPK